MLVTDWRSLAHREIKREDDAVSLSSGTSEEDAVRSYLMQQRLTPEAAVASAAFPPSSSGHHYHALPPPPPPPIAFPVPSPPYLRPQA